MIQWKCIKTCYSEKRLYEQNEVVAAPSPPCKEYFVKHEPAAPAKNLKTKE